MEYYINSDGQRVRIRKRKNLDTDTPNPAEAPKPSVNVEKEDEDYEVGYGKPPKHGQFKKGQSGNKKGRPKGSKNIRTSTLAFLDGNVTIMKDGKPTTISVRDSLLEGLYAHGMKGKVAALAQLIQLGMQFEAIRDAMEDNGLSKEDAAMLLEHFKNGLLGQFSDGHEHNPHSSDNNDSDSSKDTHEEDTDND